MGGLVQEALNDTNDEFPPITKDFDEKGEYIDQIAIDNTQRFRDKDDVPKLKKKESEEEPETFK